MSKGQSAEITTADALFDALSRGDAIVMGMEQACILSRKAAQEWGSKTIRELWIRQGANKTVAKALAAIPRKGEERPKKKGGAR